MIPIIIGFIFIISSTAYILNRSTHTINNDDTSYVQDPIRRAILNRLIAEGKAVPSYGKNI